MTEISILGSSSGHASPDRANASILIGLGDSLYQLDAGEGCSSSIKRNKIDHSRISTIMITHMHPDHITGLFLEIQMMHLVKRTQPLTVYLPSEAIDSVSSFMKATYLFEGNLGFEFRLRPIMPDPFFRDDNIAVYCRANTHFAKYGDIIRRAGASNQLQSYTFIVKTNDLKIIYSGDIGSVDDYSDLLPGCQVLITEGMHLNLDELFQKASAGGVGHLVLTHLLDEQYDNPREFLNLADKYGINNLHIASDGMVLSV